MPGSDARAAREALFGGDLGFAAHAYVIGVAGELNVFAIHSLGEWVSFEI